MGPETWWLSGVEGAAKKVQQPIKGALLIGRGLYNHVVLKDKRVSRQHARLALEAEGCVVYDLGTSNGTLVNGLPVTRCVLKTGDEVSFGAIRFQVTLSPRKGSDPDFTADLETPTVREFAPSSVSKLVASPSLDSNRDSARQLPAAADLNQLEDAYEKLGTLYSFMQAISQTIEQKTLLILIAGKIRTIYQASNAVSIYLATRETGETTFELADCVLEPPREPPPRTLPQDIAQRMRDARKGAMLGPISGRPGSSANMYVPLADRDQLLGVIHVAAAAHTNGFTSADLHLLAGMAAPAAMMLQNAKNHAESLQRNRLRYDLELASQIQKSFLPREVVSVEGLELFAEYRAAHAVGGDFYDVFWVAPGRLGVFIGDISGKGISGALLMARISSELRVAAIAQIDPVTVLTTMNTSLLHRNQPELFFTAIYLTLEVASGEIVLANAGHPAPYISRANGSLVEVASGAAGAVGILDEPKFESTKVRLDHGDSLVLYTDGVIEATGPTGVMFGQERLHRTLKGNPRPTDIAERILAGVDRHLGSERANDDVTLLVCQRNVGRPPSMQPRRRSSQLSAVRID